MHPLDSLLTTPPWRLGVFTLELLLAILLSVWLRSTSRKPPPALLLLQLVGWGSVTALLSASIELHFSLPRTAFSSQFVNITLSSTLEELAKYAVAAWLLLPTHAIRKASDAPLFLILIGLGFALAEDAVFLSDPNTIAPYRLLSFFLHSGTSAIVGIHFGNYLVGQESWWRLSLGIMSAIFLHFLYNATTLVDGRSGTALTVLVSLLISIQVFLLYRRAVVEEFTTERAGTPPRRIRLLNIG